MNTSKKVSAFFFKNQVHFLRENFIVKDEELFQKFSFAVEKFCHFVFEIDKLIDGDFKFADLYKTNDNKVYQLVTNHQKAIRELGNLFPEDHQFWADLDKTNYQYYQILLKEKYENEQKSIFDIKDFEEYAESKHCLAYIPIIGLSYLFESKVETKAINDIFRKIFLGMQMNDDLEDFNSDQISGQWTYAHSRVEQFMIDNNLTENSELDKFRERVLYISGIGEQLMQYSKEQFIAAKQLCTEYHLFTLDNWLENTLTVINENEQLILKLTSN